MRSNMSSAISYDGRTRVISDLRFQLEESFREHALLDAMLPKIVDDRSAVSWTHPEYSAERLASLRYCAESVDMDVEVGIPYTGMPPDARR